MRLALVLILITVAVAGSAELRGPSALEAICLAFQAAQNSLNGTAAGNLFTKDGVMEVPAGSSPDIGPVRFLENIYNRIQYAIAKSFNAYFATLAFQQEIILTPILINANWATYTKLATGKLKSGAPFSTLELNWYEFDLSSPTPQIKTFRALFTDMLNNTTHQMHFP